MKPAEGPRLSAVLLAAGPSSRLRQPKQLLRIHGESLVRRAARLLLSLDIASVVVVTGYRAVSVKEEIQDLPVVISHNRSWEQGMGGSIASGIASLPEDVDGVLIALCDQWRLERNDFFRLISAWSTDISHIYAAHWMHEITTVFGPPVIFPRNVMRELKNINRKRGAKSIITHHRDVARFVNMENAVFDVDTEADLEALPSGSWQFPNS